MSESYLRRLARIEHLSKAWYYLSDKKRTRQRNASGIDGVSINQFSQRSTEFLEDTRRDLLRPGGYQFKDLQDHPEEKADGSKRIICVPTVRDRVVQRAILDLLAESPDYKFESKASYGFLKGRTVPSAVREAVRLRTSHRWAYKTDISSFFDSIDRKKLREKIGQKVRPRSLQPLIIRATECEVRAKNAKHAKELRKAGIIRGKGLRQGMPISPYLSNLFLFDFDNLVEKMGYRMIRYADDLIVLADSKEECEDIHAVFETELRSIGLRIEPIGQKKTKISPPDESIDFLGIEIARTQNGYAPVVSERCRNQIKCSLYAMGDLEQLLEAGVTVIGFGRKLDGRIAGWKSTYKYCSNSAQLHDMLNDGKEEVIRRVFVGGMGVNLTAANKRFLGLR